MTRVEMVCSGTMKKKMRTWRRRIWLGKWVSRSQRVHQFLTTRLQKNENKLNYMEIQSMLQHREPKLEWTSLKSKRTQETTDTREKLTNFSPTFSPLTKAFWEKESREQLGSPLRSCHLQLRDGTQIFRLKSKSMLEMLTLIKQSRTNLVHLCCQPLTIPVTLLFKSQI